MPRNPSTGVYSKPAGTTPSVGQVIDPVPWNALTTDLGNEITNSLPRDGSAPMVAPLKAASGTVSAPGVGFASNPQTGLHLKGGGLLGFTQNGVDVAFDKASVYAAKSGDYTALASDDNAVHRFTAAATLTLTAAATLGANWHYAVIADGGDVTIDPNGSETIDGAASLVVPNGYSAFIICSGSAFFTDRMASTLKTSSGVRTRWAHLRADSFQQCRRSNKLDRYRSRRGSKRWYNPSSHEPCKYVDQGRKRRVGRGLRQWLA
ncbi:hypothetical protein [Rhizobium laguerreae]|uniref:hypothetical protein n=1 Tax=Rhizobium laguerreae TaxID=1076926 RepID=UPI0035E42B75